MEIFEFLWDVFCKWILFTGKDWGCTCLMSKWKCNKNFEVKEKSQNILTFVPKIPWEKYRRNGSLWACNMFKFCLKRVDSPGIHVVHPYSSIDVTAAWACNMFKFCLKQVDSPGLHLSAWFKKLERCQIIDLTYVLWYYWIMLGCHFCSERHHSIVPSC